MFIKKHIYCLKLNTTDKRRTIFYEKYTSQAPEAKSEDIPYLFKDSKQTY